MNKLLHIINRVRNAGFRKVIAFLRILPYRRRLIRMIRTSATGETHPVRGITIIGPMARAASTSKVLRDFAHSIKDAGIPFQVLDTDPRCQVPQEDIEGIVTSTDKFDIRKYDHVVEMLTSIVPDIDGVSKSRIAFWEFADGFREGCIDLIHSRHIITMSDFCTEFYRRELPPEINVTKVLYPFRFKHNDLPSVDEITLIMVRDLAGRILMAL